MSGQAWTEYHHERFVVRYENGSGILVENGAHGHPGYGVNRYNRGWILPEIEDGTRDGVWRDCDGCYCTDDSACCFCGDNLHH